MTDDRFVVVQKFIADWDVPFEKGIVKGRTLDTVTATFSKPTSSQPVPSSVVSIHFKLKEVKEKKRGGRQTKGRKFEIDNYRSTSLYLNQQLEFTPFEPLS